MKIEEAKKLKKGDLVTINRHKCYEGLVLEVAETDLPHDNLCLRVTLKQPKINSSFRIENVDTRYLNKFET